MKRAVGAREKRRALTYMYLVRYQQKHSASCDERWHQRKCWRAPGLVAAAKGGVTRRRAGNSGILRYISI